MGCEMRCDECKWWVREYEESETGECLSILDNEYASAHVEVDGERAMLLTDAAHFCADFEGIE